MSLYLADAISLLYLTFDVFCNIFFLGYPAIT